MIPLERIKNLNDKEIKNGKYVFYWMQASQRARYNHALEYAILKANELRKPLFVFFAIIDNFPQANERHYAFMLEGLKETQKALKERNIEMIIWHKPIEESVIKLAKDSCLVICDRGYLKIQRKWRKHIAENIDCPLIQVESDVIVPVEQASQKEEYSAATIRPKIHSKLNYFLKPVEEYDLKIKTDFDLESFDIEDIDSALKKLNVDRSVKKIDFFKGGTFQAEKHLKDFIEKKLENYSTLRNDPNLDCLSNMSIYLHFGQISPLYIALKVGKEKNESVNAYLEELIVRRELSMNYTFYNENYDSFYGLPQWAQKTLLEHKKDRRKYLYNFSDLENAKTHDKYWNAAQKEMVLKGKMHGYMRMYWGKKIIEWTKDPVEAFRIMLELNNKYEIDGRDPNGFTGVSWCFGKHDRPWTKREIFGNIRYMNENGLKRKFDADRYAKNILGESKWK